jgi:ABC-type amino acid transport substrate-binding protein
MPCKRITSEGNIHGTSSHPDLPGWHRSCGTRAVGLWLQLTDPHRNDCCEQGRRRSNVRRQRRLDPALVAKIPAKIKTAGKIVVGTDATYQPNEYLDTDGKTVIGMDVDSSTPWAKFGLKTEYVPSAASTRSSSV